MNKFFLRRVLACLVIFLASCGGNSSAPSAVAPDDTTDTTDPDGSDDPTDTAGAPDDPPAPVTPIVSDPWTGPGCNRLVNGDFEGGSETPWIGTATKTLTDQAWLGSYAMTIRDGWIRQWLPAPPVGTPFVFRGKYQGDDGDSFIGVGVDYLDNNGEQIDQTFLHVEPHLPLGTRYVDPWRTFEHETTVLPGTHTMRLWAYASNGRTLTVDQLDYRRKGCVDESTDPGLFAYDMPEAWASSTLACSTDRLRNGYGVNGLYDRNGLYNWRSYMSAVAGIGSVSQGHLSVAASEVPEICGLRNKHDIKAELQASDFFGDGPLSGGYGIGYKEALLDDGSRTLTAETTSPRNAGAYYRSLSVRISPRGEFLSCTDTVMTGTRRVGVTEVETTVCGRGARPLPTQDLASSVIEFSVQRLPDSGNSFVDPIFSQPRISDDGRYIGYKLREEPEDGTRTRYAAFRYDRMTDTVQRVADNVVRDLPAQLSGDGRYLQYATECDELIPGFDPAQESYLRCHQLYVHDFNENRAIALGLPMQSTTTSASPEFIKVGLLPRAAPFSQIAGNGQVALVSEYYQPNFPTAALRFSPYVVSVATNERLLELNTFVDDAAISDDGRYLAWTVPESEPGSVTTRSVLYLQDIISGERRMGGLVALGSTLSLSTDGRRVRYQSADGADSDNTDWQQFDFATQLVSPVQGPFELKSRDERINVEARIGDDEINDIGLMGSTNQTMAVLSGNGDSTPVAVSADGNTLLFLSEATNFGDTPAQASTGIFIADLTSIPRD